MNNIIFYPDPLLRKKSSEVKLPLNDDDIKLLKEMYAFVKDDANNALGLSAVQVGVLKKICVVKTSLGMFKLVNPKIIWHSNSKMFRSEGCLSVKEEHDDCIPRWEKIKVSAFDAIKNKPIILNLEGRSAAVIQHELDHMDGILYIDYIGKED